MQIVFNYTVLVIFRNVLNVCPITIIHLHLSVPNIIRNQNFQNKYLLCRSSTIHWHRLFSLHCQCNRPCSSHRFSPSPNNLLLQFSQLPGFEFLMSSHQDFINCIKISETTNNCHNTSNNKKYCISGFCEICIFIHSENLVKRCLLHLMNWNLRISWCTNENKTNCQYKTANNRLDIHLKFKDG